MIFVLHYVLFSSGLSFVIILTALFLKTYSDASMAEIGGLLMALPFLSIIARPFFCALADRHQAHRLYLMGACFFMCLGYGSLAIAPFFPDLIERHGRLIWYLDIVGIVIGYSAYSVVFSLGDALVLNAARKRGISWSLYRVWSTLSWGVFGYLIGLFNETPALPKYVPGIFLLVCSMVAEMILLGLWNKKAFDMNDHVDTESELDQTRPEVKHDDLSLSKEEFSSSPFGTMSGANSRLVGALAGMVVEDIGSTLRSSLRMGQQQKRAGLSEILGQQTVAQSMTKEASEANDARGSLRGSKKEVDASIDSSTMFGPATLARASGHKLNNNMTANDVDSVDLKTDQSEVVAANKCCVDIEEDSKCGGRKSDEDLQIMLLKFLVRRDPTILKLLFTFALFGFLESLHSSYFFLHVEEVCRWEGYDFSRLMGSMVVAQSISEIFSFLVLVRYYMPLVGQMGSLLSCAVLFAARFLYYGTYFAQLSPYMALATECCYGFAYAMLYMLVCECASDSVEQLDQYLPELKSRGLIDPRTNENQLKLPLRATMQGVFSGAFDGLGYGLGALFGGFYLNRSKDYTSLWLISAAISGMTFTHILLTHGRTAAAAAAAKPLAPVGAN